MIPAFFCYSLCCPPLSAQQTSLYSSANKIGQNIYNVREKKSKIVEKQLFSVILFFCLSAFSFSDFSFSLLSQKCPQ